jgi:hypothetical protein
MSNLNPTPRLGFCRHIISSSMGVPCKCSVTSNLKVWTMHFYIMALIDVYGSQAIPKYNEK